MMVYIDLNRSASLIDCIDLFLLFSRCFVVENVHVTPGLLHELRAGRREHRSTRGEGGGRAVMKKDIAMPILWIMVIRA